MSESLDLTAPLWEAHVVTDLDDGRHALVLKLHHALCDGHGALRLGLALLDGPADPAPTTSSPKPGLADLVGSLATRAHRLVHDLPRLTLLAVDVAEHFRAAASSPLASRPHLAGDIRARRVALARLSATDVAHVRARFGGTVHDVLLTVLSGALRSWMCSMGLTGEVRALIPVNHRARAGDTGTGNRLSGYLCHLPIAEPDPRRRFSLVTTAMANNKAAGARRGPGAFPLLAEGVPHAVHHLVTPLLATQAGRLFDLVATTIRLPARIPALAGVPIDEVYPVAPLAPGHRLAVAFAHDRRHVHVGVTTNPDVANDVDKLVEALHTSLSELAHG